MNLGRIFESEETMNKYFYGAYEKASKADDENGVDGYLNGVPVQVKCGIHSDGGESPLHGYSIVHKTSQRKLQNVKWLIYALPAVIQYVPRYKLDHTVAIIYKIDRVAAIKRKLFKYSKTGEIYLDKKSRLILDNMVKDGKADMIDIFTIQLQVTLRGHFFILCELVKMFN